MTYDDQTILALMQAMTNGDGEPLRGESLENFFATIKDMLNRRRPGMMITREVLEDAVNKEFIIDKMVKAMGDNDTAYIHFAKERTAKHV